MRKTYNILLTGVLGVLLLTTFYQLQSLETIRKISEYYIQNGVQDTGAINLVTSILFDYRGFDTLGEATVILTAAAAVNFLVPRKPASMLGTKFSIIVYQTIIFIVPFLGILGMYLIVFGHLSPGGGFTGGVVLATISILLTITYGAHFSRKHFTPRTRSLLESSGAVFFVSLGMLGIAAGGNFLANGQAGFNLGIPGDLFSAGLIPYFNLAVGIKVGAGLAIIFHCLSKEEQ